MGVDLSLFPVGHVIARDWCSFSRIEVNRRRELWPAVHALPAVAIGTLTGYLDKGFHAETTDKYGARLKAVTAGDLATLAAAPGIADDSQNRAVWAYLAALPPATDIVLYWH